MDGKWNRATAGALLVLAGAAVGATVALLFAPQSGAKTRRDIARHAKKARGKVEDLAGDLSETISGMVESIGESTRSIVEKGKDLAEDKKKAILTVVDEGIAKLEEQRAKLARRVA